MIGDNFQFERLAIQIDLQSRSLAGAVITHREVLPFAGFQSLFRLHANGISWPEVNDGGGGLPVEQQKLVADAAGVIRAVPPTEKVFAGRDRMRANPQRCGIRMLAGKVADVREFQWIDFSGLAMAKRPTSLLGMIGAFFRTGAALAPGAGPIILGGLLMHRLLAEKESRALIADLRLRLKEP